MKKLGLLNAALLIAAGCTVDVVFDPFGDEVSLDVSWTIDGLPADATTCEELGASTIEVQIWEETGSDFVTDGAWEANCTSGGFTTGPVLRADTYRVRLVALDAAGRSAGATSFSRVVANPGEAIVVEADFVPVEVFDPSGTEVDIEAAWTIEGGFADAASCDALGADRVQIQVWNAERTIFWLDPALSAPCADGALATAPILAAGTYSLRFAAMGGGGTVDQTDFIDVTVGAGETIVADADFVLAAPVDATLAGSWEIDGVIADATSCADAGIDTVVLSVANDAAGTDLFIEYEFDCALGSFDSRTDGTGVTLPIGSSFFYRWLAENAAGDLLAESDAIELLVDDTHENLGIPSFPGGNTLIVNILWETDLDTGVYDTCAASAVDTMGYDLYDSFSDRVVSEFDIFCEDQLIFEDVLPDTYELDLIGDATDGTKWGTTCTGLTVTGGMATYDCFVDVEL